MTSDLEARLWVLESERDIRGLIHQYCDAADRRDWAAFRAVFHEGSTHRHDHVYEGLSSDFAGLGQGMIDLVAESHHHVGNVSIRVTGNSAVSQCYLIAHHLILADTPVEVFPRHTPGVDEEWLVGGRYFDRLEYRGGRWGIVHRTAIHDWERWERADARGFKQQLFTLPPLISPLEMEVLA